MKLLLPWAQHNHRFITFNLRTSGPSEAYKEPVRKVLAALAPDLAPTVLETVEEELASDLSYFTFLRRLLVQIAGLGLLLSAIGIYGVVANLASERTKEIGIRMALGAQPSSLVWLFLRNGLQLAAIGTALGLFAAYALITVLSRVIPNLPGSDPRMVAIVATGLVVVALVACWVPARRTTRISPTVALRTE
jgi:ABC-type lipoprotein release transport system permease subunit